jgi:hypothetical protein
MNFFNRKRCRRGGTTVLLLPTTSFESGGHGSHFSQLNKLKKYRIDFTYLHPSSTHQSSMFAFWLSQVTANKAPLIRSRTLPALLKFPGFKRISFFILVFFQQSA